MKNFLLTLACSIALSATTNAQITLTQSSYSANNTGTDSTRVTTYNNTTFPNLHAATNGMWDMTLMSDSSSILKYRVATDDTTQFADSNFYGFAGVVYNANIQSSVLANGVIEYGEHINRQAFHGTLPGPNDSIVINGQDIAYTSPRTKIAFPATYNSNWTSSYQYNTYFTLSVAAFSLNHAPGIIKSNETTRDTVVGWGQMRVKDANGNASGWMTVLQVNSMTTITDSFFLNGAPASPILLGFFSIIQGQKDTTYEQNYYRPMELTPLANVQFHGAGNSSPYMSHTHEQRLAQPSSVGHLTNSSLVNVYPNPVTNRTFSLELPLSNESSNYELVNMAGQIVMKDVIAANSNRLAISLSSNVTPGIYYIRVCNNGQTFTLPVDIIK